MQTEFEIKFYPVNKDALRQQLTKLGAVCTHPRRLMRRKAYPVANHGVDSKYFRVRDEGEINGNRKITCTYKQVGDTSDINAVQEIEVSVSDYDAMNAIFEAIGHTPKAIQESYREERKLSDGCACMIDQRPGTECFVEIEGVDETTVRHRSKTLGFERESGIFGTVVDVYQKFLGTERDFIANYPKLTFDNPPVLSTS